ncbi:MAG: FeoA family protein [Bacteroidota bacterium]|nr:FeoA family protein [Bacteroidota bacterium]
MPASEIPLSHAPLCRPLVVCGYSGTKPFVERFRELGFIYGARVILRRRAPLGRSIEVEVGGIRLGLRLHEAAMIYVRPITPDAADDIAN